VTTAPTRGDYVDPHDLLGLIRSRRVVRDLTPEPVGDDDLLMVLEAGLWATSGGNNRIHRFLVVRDPRTIRLVVDLSPGIFSPPGVMIVVCADLDVAERLELDMERYKTPWIDVGTAAMNMMMQAHALGLGSCPATSFSRSGVEAVLELPPQAEPALILQVGHRPAGTAAAPRPTGTSSRLARFVYWERYGHTRPELGRRS
jgi:albonoursin synthase